MTTISFSVEDKLAKDVTRWATKMKKSKSDVFRDMAATYLFAEQLGGFQATTAKKLQALGIDSEQELYDYLESDQNYADRARHQRLSGSHKK